MSLLLTVIWIVSGAYSIEVQNDHRDFTYRISYGELEISRRHVPDARPLGTPHWRMNGNYRYKLEWSPTFAKVIGPRGDWMTQIPIWWMWVLVAPITAELWRRELVGRPSRTLIGKCMRCKFDLVGLPEGAVCPECGPSASAGND